MFFVINDASVMMGQEMADVVAENYPLGFEFPLWTGERGRWSFLMPLYCFLIL